MNLQDFSAAMALTPVEQAFLETCNFPALAADFPGFSEYMRPEYYLPFLNRLQRGAELAAAMAPVSEQLRTDTTAQEFFHLSRTLRFCRTPPPAYASPLPPAERIFGERGGLCHLLLAISAYPLWVESYRKLGVPQSYADASFCYLDGAIDEYAAGNRGVPGIAPSKLHWLRHYVDGRLFRIGRFEYMMQAPHASLPVLYRNNATREIVGLCPSNWRLRADGLIQWLDEDPDKAYRVTRLENSAEELSGTPIDFRGFARVDERRSLKLAEYTPVFTPWDLVPGLHIPGGGRMTPEACTESFRLAREFFRRYFHREIAGISCFSWIFNPSFIAELPESNLTWLMRHIYLFPFPPTGVEGLQFVFGRSDEDWHDYPRDNSLRRAFHHLRETGVRLKAGGMFLDGDLLDKLSPPGA